MSSLDEKTTFNEIIRTKPKKIGLAVGSHSVGSSYTVSQALNFCRSCQINLLIIDFGWVTWAWPNTDKNEIKTLIEKSKQANISIWLMYRDRSSDHNLPHQVYRDNTSDPSIICYSHQKCRHWSISWAQTLLDHYPGVEGMILYNPRVLPDCCYCSKCIQDFEETTDIHKDPRSPNMTASENQTWLVWRAEVLTNYMTKWQEQILSTHDALQTGIVIVPQTQGAMDLGQNITALGTCLEVVCPFVVVHSDLGFNETVAGEVCIETKNLVPCDVIANIKIYGPYNNGELDIINAMLSSMRSNADGFFIWSYDYLLEEGYNLELIIKAYNEVQNTEFPSTIASTSADFPWTIMLNSLFPIAIVKKMIKPRTRMKIRAKNENFS
ncbi:MAG: hypothetical protein ACFFB3_03105 [Candidatus Hodarchaeota archaeon]